jgi:hypothetical protein
LSRGGKILQRPGPVALLAPQLAARVEDIGERGIEPQHGAVIVDGAIEHVPARKNAGARD